MDGGGAAGDEPVDLGELGVGGGEADLQSFGFAGPAFTFGLGDAVVRLSRMLWRRGRWPGSIRRSGQRMQLCS